ncbi:M48 family metallopeptidase [Sagittula salina]|uniref:M48 family metallopeptidase n=1 Tax=Sagittula salina TaxID=2820268 RepID=A0A940S3V1_9RHOB|nr:M48 family metallopeptidase [Sagittula salina]MBP0483439.1 M48 family metallopeptidase [Sagittula salina]
MLTQAHAAHFFDGRTSARHPVTVRLSEDRIALVIEGKSLTAPLTWLLSDLRALTDTADDQRLTVTRHAQSDDESPHDVARLVILDPELIAWMHRTRPNLFRAETHPGAIRRLLIYAGGAAAACLLLLFVILPALANSLARLIPIEREIAFGKTVVRQMERQLNWLDAREGFHCTDPAGLTALDTLLQRLTGGRDMQYDISLQVFDSGMVNAFAAPGGQVVILRGLLDQAETPEEVAGVLAHELGHVESRDATRLTLRAAGSAGLLTMLIGDVTGGTAVAVLGERLLSASYTREAETAADNFALEMLANARVDVAGFGDFFDALAELEPFSLPEYLATHPATEGRAAGAHAFAAAQDETAPILTKTAWQALKAICD